MPAGDADALLPADAVDDPDGTSADGRVRRGERTRAAIVEALLGLVADGELHPTARQIAQRAGVSVRSIFQHFDDLEGLYGDLVRVQAARVQPLVEDLRSEGSLDERIDALVRQRAALFEAITPMRHAIGTRARRSPTLTRRVRELSEVRAHLVLVTGLPGISIPATVKAWLYRGATDLFVVHSRREVRDFDALRRMLSATGTVGLATLPFLSAVPASAAGAGDRRSVVFAPQAKVPRDAGARRASAGR